VAVAVVLGVAGVPEVGKVGFRFFFILLVLFCGGCEKKSKPFSIFSDDAVIRTLNHVTINKEHIPISGVTKESELPKLFPEGYNRRLSYVYPREKKFERKRIVYNRIYYYNEIINRPIEGEGISYGHVGLE
jgi:hypothetical protein